MNLPFLVPRERTLALAFLNGALAALDAAHDAYQPALRRAVLARRQELLDDPTKDGG